MRLQATIACLGGLVVWWRFGGVFPAGLAGVFSSLALLAWVAPARYAPVQRVFDFVIRQVVGGFSWALMAFVYLGVFTPVRLAWSLIGRDPLQCKADPTAITYFQPLPSVAPGRFKRLF